MLLCAFIMPNTLLEYYVNVFIIRVLTFIQFQNQDLLAVALGWAHSLSKRSPHVITDSTECKKGHTIDDIVIFLFRTLAVVKLSKMTQYAKNC